MAKQYYNFSEKQQGLSLIELIIAAFLGLLLLGGVIQIFSSTSNNYRFTEDMSRAQENGRFAIDILTRYSRMAGYSNFDTTSESRNPNPFEEIGCIDDTCSQDDTGLLNSDRLVVQLDPPDDRDCNNNAVTPGEVIRNIFWIQNDPESNVSTLYCQGYDTGTSNLIGNPQPYIAGIDSMQILYGISDGINEEVTRFVNANNVGAENWSNVKAIKIAVLAQSGLDNTINTRTQNYVLLDNPPLTFTDGRTRYVFSTTVFLSNTIGG